MNLLVTGGTGSIGAWVTRYLQDVGHHPVVYDLVVREKYLADVLDEVTVVQGDITDYDHLSATLGDHDVDRVIHLAKLLEPTSTEHPGRALDINVVGSGNVFRAANEHGIDRVAYSSSKSAFAEITGEYAPPTFEPLPPDYPKFDPTTSTFIPFYSLTNRMVEYFGMRYAMLKDMELVITRFGSTWGPGKIRDEDEYFEDPTGGPLISAMLDRALDGEATDGKPRTDNFVYTKDIAQAVAKCALSDDVDFENNHREMLLDAGQTYAMAEFVDAIDARFPDLDITMAAEDTGIHRTGVQCLFDSTRAREELGYEPAFTDVGDAVEDYIETERAARARQPAS